MFACLRFCLHILSHGGIKMIIRINGNILEAPGGSVSVQSPFRSVTIRKAERESNLRKYVSLGHKIAFGLALCTMVADMFMGGAVTAFAAGSQSVGITSAFEPVKKLLIDLADPLCYVMFVWGCIECIVGRPASGLNRMKYASIGYIAINWIPVVMATIRAAAPS
jgi:hypothetical protein